MDSCSWTVFIFKYFVLKNKNIILVNTANEIKAIKLVINKNLEYYWDTFQPDQDSFGIPGVTTSGYGSCWEYFIQSKPPTNSDRQLLEAISPRFDLDRVSSHKNVLILDEFGDELVFNFKEKQNSSGATCKRCGDYNPYAECESGKDFYCYSCRN